jgi:hypothetical protein
VVKGAERVVTRPSAKSRQLHQSNQDARQKKTKRRRLDLKNASSSDGGNADIFGNV